MKNILAYKLLFGDVVPSPKTDYRRNIRRYVTQMNIIVI